VYLYTAHLNKKSQGAQLTVFQSAVLFFYLILSTYIPRHTSIPHPITAATGCW